MIPDTEVYEGHQIDVRTYMNKNEDPVKSHLHPPIHGRRLNVNKEFVLKSLALPFSQFSHSCFFKCVDDVGATLSLQPLTVCS